MRIDRKLNLDLSESDGNAFALLGAFKKQAQKEDWSKEEIGKVIKKACSSNYDHLVDTILSYCSQESLDASNII